MVNLADLLNDAEESLDTLVGLHRELVRIPSVNTGVMPTGNESDVAEYAKTWLNQEQIQADILESAPGRGNLIAKLKGSSDENKLLFMSHLDVVPVEDYTKWTYEPFGAVLANGRIYGRGASDCKGLLACQMMALKLLKNHNVELTDNLILASGADEESGGRYGFGWLAENHPEKIRAAMAVNEGGGTHINIAGTTTYLLGIGEKGRLEVKLSVKGTSAHASTPWLGENASFKVARVLKALEAYRATRDTSADIFKYLPTLAIEHKITADNVDDVIEEIGRNNPELSSILKALSRMTVTPTMIEGGIKSNSIPEMCEITCDIRTLPHQNEEYVAKELAGILKEVEGVAMDIDYMAVPNRSPYETYFAESIKEATRVSLNRDDLNWAPAIATGFTDSRFLRNLGTTTYGFNGSHPDDDPLLTHAHGTDESIGVKSLLNGTKVMLALAHRLVIS